VASVAEAKHRRSSALPVSSTVRSASHAGDTRVLRCGFGRTLEPGDRRMGRHLLSRQGTAPWVLGFTGHDQTPKQPEGAMVGVGTSIDAVPRDRRRWRPHGGFSLDNRATAVATSQQPGVRGRRVCFGPLIWFLRASCTERPVGRPVQLTPRPVATTNELGSYPCFRSRASGPVSLASVATTWSVLSGRVIGSSTDGRNGPVLGINDGTDRKDPRSSHMRAGWLQASVGIWV